MLRKRIIPVILLKNGRVVQSKHFSRHQVLGNPSTIVSRLSNWLADEVIYLDISRDDVIDDYQRQDLKKKTQGSVVEMLEVTSKTCFMPMTAGGKIRTLDEINERITNGADKVSINTKALETPGFIKEAAQAFGSQCIVVSMDAKKTGDNTWEVFSHFGKTPTGLSVVDWARQVEALGAGEILLNSIDNDGVGQGYDIPLVKSVVDAVKIPVIALGGAGNWEHMADCLKQANPSAIAAANILQHSENTVFKAQKHLFELGLDVRPPSIKTIIPFSGA